MADSAVKIPFTEAAAPSTPAANKVVIYAKSDGLMYSKDDAGSETLMSAGGGGIPATILDAKGDMIAATAADTAAKLSIAGTNGYVLQEDSAQSTGLKFAYPVLTTLENIITSPVTMTNANTFYDGPSINLGSVGTWFLSGSIFLENTSGTATTEFGAKLWDGTTAETAADWLTRFTNDRITLHLSGIVTLSGSTTMKISAVNTNAGCTINDASANNNVGDKYTYLHAVRVA